MSERVAIQMHDSELGCGPYYFLAPAGMAGEEAVALFDTTVAKVQEDEWYEFGDLVAARAPLGFSDPFERHPIFEAGVEW